MSAPLPADLARPLVADLERDIVRADLAAEALVAALFRDTGFLPRALSLWLSGRGPTLVTEALARGLFDVALAPVNADAKAALDAARAEGRPVTVVSAMAPADAAAIAGAQGLELSEAAPGDAERLAAKTGKGGLKAWIKAARIHQWAKNGLLFAPLLLAHAFMDLNAWAMCIAGFVILGVAASSTYIINDLSDLDADRRHATKRRRPFAAGDLTARQGLIAAPVGLLLAFIAAFALSPAFAGLLAAYTVTTLAYSFKIKRVALLDTTVLAGLYTLRLVIGGVLAGVVLSPWFLAFALAFFLSLAMAKRYVELVKLARKEGKEAAIAGRGYAAADRPLVLAQGISAGLASLIVMALYVADVASTQYANPAWLWTFIPVIHLFLSRVWLLAHRGELHDDPVVFALKDSKSAILGLAAVAGFVLAL
jgi:4-hydroxybenzoate polyprenyltransferase